MRLAISVSQMSKRNVQFFESPSFSSTCSALGARDQQRLVAPQSGFRDAVERHVKAMIRVVFPRRPVAYPTDRELVDRKPRAWGNLRTRR
jgi:hypothetical protein